MNQKQLLSLTKLLKWDVSWSNDYFNKSRDSADVFYDLLEPQGIGACIDWKYEASDVIGMIKELIPSCNVTAAESSVTSISKPYNSANERYRKVSLKSEDRAIDATYLSSEVDYLAHKVMSLVDTKGCRLAVWATFDENHAFVLVKNDAPIELLEGVGLFELKESTSSTVLMNIDSPARAKYFYVPFYTSSLKDVADDNSQGSVDVLKYDNGYESKPLSYASRVLPGQTLAEAVAFDLKNDFRYAGHHEIADVQTLDTAKDKQGNELTRLLVHVRVEDFKTDGIEVAGLRPGWETRPLAYVHDNYDLGFSLTASS